MHRVGRKSNRNAEHRRTAALRFHSRPERFAQPAVDGKLVLRVKKKLAHLVTETASRRFDAAAQALGLTAETKIT